MFISWGIYDGEWVMHNKKIPYDNCKRLARFFNPQQLNAKEWVQLAKSCRYKVHHHNVQSS